METTKRYKVKSGNIHSLKDIELEKHRLRIEILKTEANIQSGYRNILHALTFKNLAATLVSDVTSTSTVMSKVFAFGKSMMEKRKKKKHDKLKTISDDLRS